MKKLICIFAFLMMLTGCKSVETQLMVEKDTVWVYNLEKDSVYLLDSVFVHEYQKGETVYVDREKYSVFYRDRVKHDSIYIHKTDTIVRTVVEKVERRLNAFQQVKMHVGGIVLWALFFLLGFQLWRWYKCK